MINCIYNKTNYYYDSHSPIIRYYRLFATTFRVIQSRALYLPFSQALLVLRGSTVELHLRNPVAPGQRLLPPGVAGRGVRSVPGRGRSAEVR